jgi:hypothetical protein
VIQRKTRRIGTAAGLFAILLLVFAPLVSQVLRAHDPANLALRSICSAAHADGSQGNQHALDDQACAYCGLALKSPMLSGYGVPELALAEPVRFGVPEHLATRWVARSLITSQPRGPPALS